MFIQYLWKEVPYQASKGWEPASSEAPTQASCRSAPAGPGTWEAPLLGDPGSGREEALARPPPYCSLRFLLWHPPTALGHTCIIIARNKGFVSLL